MNQQGVEESSKDPSTYIDEIATLIRELCAAGGHAPYRYPHVARLSDDIHQAEQAGIANKAEILACWRVNHWAPTCFWSMKKINFYIANRNNLTSILPMLFNEY